MVAEPLATLLAAPLRDGQELLYFHSPEECVARCRELLNDPLRAAGLAEHAKRYYDAHVQPAASMLRLLRSALRTDGAAPSQHATAPNAEPISGQPPW